MLVGMDGSRIVHRRNACPVNAGIIGLIDEDAAIILNQHVHTKSLGLMVLSRKLFNMYI